MIQPLVDKCCGGLEKIAKRADFPFERPLYVDPETHQLRVGAWAVKLFKKTPSGRVSSKSAGLLALNYCPICGVQLLEPGEDAGG